MTIKMDLTLRRLRFGNLRKLFIFLSDSTRDPALCLITSLSYQAAPVLWKKAMEEWKARFSIYIERKLAPNKDKVNVQLNLIKK